MISVKKPNTIAPGKGSERDGIARWDNYQGIDYVIRSRPVLRTNDKPTNFTVEDETRLTLINQKIEASNNLLPTEMEHVKIRRAEAMDRYISERDALLRKRQDLTDWEYREIARCLFGHNTLTGKHYYYYNYVWIEENVEGGEDSGGGKRPIQPLYRACDDWFWRMIILVEKEATGTVGGKRRQFGYSWLSAADDSYDMNFRDGVTFFVSKDEDDAKKYFLRFTHIYDNLPDFLKKPWLENAEDTKSFGENEKIRAVREHFKLIKPGAILSRARLRTGSPRNPGSLAGDTISKVKVDEIGEIGNPTDIFGKMEPALRKGNSRKRAGCWISFGTVDKMRKHGRKFKTFYKAASALKLRQFIIPGWMGIDVDECGNEPREEIIADIQKTIENYTKAGLIGLANEERQKSPLTEADMFITSGENKLLSTIHIGLALDRLEEHAPGHNIKYGLFREDPSTGRVFFEQQEPAPSRDEVNAPRHIGWGQVKLREEPVISGFRDVYGAGCDPVTMDKDRHGETDLSIMHSDFAFSIRKRFAVEVGGVGNMPVCMYSGRPANLDNAYEQLYLALRYYDDAQVNIEKVKGDRLYNFFKLRGRLDLVATKVSAVSANKETSRIRTAEYGYNTSETWWIQILEQYDEYLKANYHNIDFEQLLYECSVAREENTDELVAELAAFMWCNELDLRDKRGRRREKPSDQPDRSRYDYSARRQLATMQAYNRITAGGDKSPVMQRLSKKMNRYANKK